MPISAELWSEYNAALTNQDFRRALKLSEEFARQCEKEHGKEHPDLIPLLNNMGTNYWLVKDFTHALRIMERALALQINLNGESHPDTAKYLANLGAAYLTKKKLDA